MIRTGAVLLSYAAGCSADAIKLAAEPLTDTAPSKSPLIPAIDHEKIAMSNMIPGAPMSPLMMQAIATLAVIAILALVACQIKCWLRRKQREILSDLPEACPDGTWLVVAYEWEDAKVSSGRMPLEGIISIGDLVSAAVEYGAEAVDPEIREDNIDVKYMDLQGVERRVGAKTRFDDVKRARLLRITRKPDDPFAAPKEQEKLGLVGGSKKKRPVPKSTEMLDNDDMSMVGVGPRMQGLDSPTSPV